MEILAPLIPTLTGTLPPTILCLYLLSRSSYQDKEIQRQRKTISSLRASFKEEIKELSQAVGKQNNVFDERIKKIEFKIAKIWSDS